MREGGEGEKQRSESLACLPFAWQSCEERTRRAGLGAGRGRARSSSRARFPSPPLAFAGAGQADDEQTGLSESGRNDPAVNRSTHFAPGPQAPSSPAVLPSGPPAAPPPPRLPPCSAPPPPFPSLSPSLAVAHHGHTGLVPGSRRRPSSSPLAPPRPRLLLPAGCLPCCSLPRGHAHLPGLSCLHHFLSDESPPSSAQTFVHPVTAPQKADRQPTLCSATWSRAAGCVFIWSQVSFSWVTRVPLLAPITSPIFLLNVASCSLRP